MNNTTMNNTTMNNTTNITTITRNPARGITVACVLCTLLAGTACGDGDGGTGTLKVTTYGEDFIEQQIPAASGGGEGIVDGYTVTYSKFLVCLDGLTVADRDGNVGARLTEQRVFDLHPAGPHSVTTFDDLDARRWDSVGVRVAPASGATAGNATTADVKLMNNGGHSVYVEGQSVKGSDTLSFQWGFATTTRYEDCQEKSTGSGIVIPSGGAATIEFTIHGDHLLYDDLQSADPSLRFEAIANADADSDGEVTLQELSQVDLTTLPPSQYGTGGAGSVKTLADFVTALTRTLVHYQGEGHCHSGS